MNNGGNRLLATILVFVMMSFSCTFVQGAPLTVTSAEAEFNSETNLVTVSGVQPYGEGSRVSIEVKLGGSTFYKREVSAGANGEFSISYKMDVGTEEAEVDHTGVYDVYIGGAGLSAVVKNYPFISKRSGVSIVSAADGAVTAGDMQSVLEHNSATLNIDLTGGSFGALSAEGKTAVYSALATNNNFGTANNIVNMFNSAVAIQTLNETSTANAQTVVEQNKKILGFNLDAGSNFAKIQKNSNKDLVYGAMVGKSLSLADKALVVKAFESAVYTQLFNEVTTETRDSFMTYINECINAGYASVSLTNYNSTLLNDTDRADIIATVISQASQTPFATLDAVKTAFEGAAQTKVSSKNNQGGGGGGGATSGDEIKIKDTVTEEETKKPEENVPESEIESVFTDLASYKWAVNAINYFAATNVVSGIGDGKFNPGGELKREEFVKMMMLALKMPSEETEKRFVDVKEGAWYYKYVQDAYALNIISGIDFDVFGVGMSISREQMCTMLYRAMKFMDINLDESKSEMNFADKGEISKYAYEAVDALYRAGIVSGVSADEFNPKGTATRAMASQMLYQLVQRGKL